MWLVYLIYLPIVLSYQFNENNIERSLDLANFAVEIVNKECKNCKTIMIIHSGQEKSCDVFFNKVHNVPSIYTVVVDGNGTDLSNNKTQELLYLPELTIIFLNTDLLTAESVIFSVELTETWNIRGKFLVLCDGEIIEDDEEFNGWLEEMFSSFWDRQALKVLLAIWKTSNEINSYTYDPFKKEYNILIEEKNRLSKWFNRLVTNMYGEPIKLYQFDTVVKHASELKILPDGKTTWVGCDGMFFSVLAESLNTTLFVHKISEDFDEDLINQADPSLPFSQYFAVFSDMFDFDILFNRMQTFSDNPLDKIFLYERNEWQIIVPKSGMVPQYLYMKLLVKEEVWIGVFLSLLSVAVIRSILGAKHAVPIWDNLAYLLGNTAPHRKQMKTKEKIVLATWSLSCVVIVTLFQTTLMSTLVVPKFYPNIDTLEDLSNSDLIIYSPEYTTIQLSRVFENNTFMNHISNVPKNITIYGTNLEWVEFYKRDYGIVISREQLYTLHKTDPGLFETNHVMSESPMPVPVAFIMPKNKLYFEEALRKFNTIQEAGLHVYWRKYDYYLERNISIHKIESKDKDQILTLFHLQSAFILLIFGLNISLITFCCEIFWYKIKKNIK